MPATTAPHVLAEYEDIPSLTPGVPLDKSSIKMTWFGTATADAYVAELLARFNERHPEAATELAYIASEACWSTGWKGFGRLIKELF